MVRCKQGLWARSSIYSKMFYRESPGGVGISVVIFNNDDEPKKKFNVLEFGLNYRSLIYTRIEIKIPEKKWEKYTLEEKLAVYLQDFLYVNFKDILTEKVGSFIITDRSEKIISGLYHFDPFRFIFYKNLKEALEGTGIPPELITC